LNGAQQRTERCGRGLFLLDAFAFGEEEEFVLENRAAHCAAELVALEGRVHGLGRGKAGAVILEDVKGFAVEIIGAGVGGDQHLTGRGQLARGILRGVVDLELADGILRDVEDRRADILIGDVLAIEQDTGGAAGEAVDGQRRISGLGRIEAVAVLQHHARLKLRQIEEVAAIDRKCVDLFGADDARDASLIRVDLHIAGLDNNLLRRLAQTELEAARGRRTGTNIGVHDKFLEARGRHRDLIGSRIQRTDAVKTCRVGSQRLVEARVLAGDGDRCTHHHSARLIRDGSLNRTTIDRNSLGMS